jgi:hypothetical protein
MKNWQALLILLALFVVAQVVFYLTSKGVI